MKIEIIVQNGKWLTNGKTYPELDWIEKVFFDNFFFAMKLKMESDQINSSLKIAS